jgi:phenylalanyl-tRNA synthetase alpha chain
MPIPEATDPLQELEQLATQAQETIAGAKSVQDLEQARIKFLGRKSRLQELMALIPALAPEQRGGVGKRANEVKRQIEARLAERKQELAALPQQSALDVTLPGMALPQGHLHPITQMQDRILALFSGMGFEIAEGPEMEFEYYNFDGLNIPPDHPSRESFDTFFVDLPSFDSKRGKLLLRSHTSPVQVRVMERRKPPVRIVVPGKVFRRDALDPGHSFMFHQVEGLMVDERTSFSDLKGILNRFLVALFGPDTKTRFRPHYFPFTEPSAEIDIASSLATGEGDSSFARKRWIEIMGCGMVHPNVLRKVGYDPAKVQGFAFGMGVERMAMLRYGIKDIRQLFENDVKLLEQC